MTSDSFRSSEQLMTSLDERPYILFSNQSDKTEKLLKTSMKELNDCLIQHQRRSTNKLQELYVNQFDEEQIWSQIRSNDNVINSKTEDLISSILANIEEVTLLPSQLAVMERKPKKKTAYDEEAWAEGQEGEGEEEGLEDEEEGAEGYEEGEEGEEGMEEEMGQEDGNDTDEEAELREFEQLDRYLENEQIGLDDEDVEGEEGEEGLGEYMEGYGEDDEDDDDEDVKEKKLRKYRLVEEEEDDEEGGRPEIDDAEVEDDVFDRAREDLLGGDDEEEAEERPKKRDAKTSEIDALEERLLQKKLWQTTGEVKAGQRPMNSLLEENLDFNITKKGTSIVTPEYSAKLEDIIKQRILDEAWDDPIQYAPDRPIKETFSNLQELNFEKTEGGLAKEYEEKYKKDIMGMKTTGPEDDLKKEIDILFKQISYNLDVLSNLSFTPKATFEQTKIVPNVASINLEEKTPLSFSKSHAKAPQELFNPNKVVFQTKEELTTAENRASRRAFKRNLRTRNKEKKKKDLIKKLEFKGQTKYEHNLQQKGLAKYKSEVNKKNQKSVTFTKSSQFFDNLEKSKKPKGKGEKEESESLNVKRKNYMM